MGADDFVLTPLPNHLFQRDNSAGSTAACRINPMAMPARLRETVHSAAIYRFHPMFAAATSTIWYGGDDRPHQPATLEGGDMHVLGNGAVMVGHGRAHHAAGRGEPGPQPVRRRRGRTRSSRSSCRNRTRIMHLDTVHDDDRPGHVRDVPVPAGRAAVVDRCPGGPATPAGSTSSRTATCSRPSPRRSASTRSACSRPARTIRAAEREQWDDGNNFLAVAPGVIVGYERNVDHQHEAAQARASRSSPSPAASSAAAAAARAA